MRELYDIPVRDRVCRAFAFAASQTWGELHDYDELEEESITDYRILQLKRMCPEEVTVIKFNKRQEGKNGADWEWWFGAQKQWFGMRVQAKRLEVATLEYASLDRTIGKSTVRQVDRLIADARERCLYPMYCFYNYWPDGTSVDWRCGTFSQNNELWGASIADAVRMKEKVDANSKNLADIAPVSMPLMCLACCRGHADSSNPTLPIRARSIAGALTGTPDIIPDLVPHPPWYVAQLRQNSRSLDLPAGLLDLDGILIVEENPDVYEGERRL